MTAPYAHPESVVETSWLAQQLASKQLASKRIQIVDLRDPEQYALGHIPGAVNLGRRDIRAYEGPPTFLHSPEQFAKQMEAHGISNQTRVVAYDDRGGGMDPAWLWWILRYYGHNNVAVLNGGWAKWSAEQLPISLEVPPIAAARFKARPQPSWLATADQVKSAIGKPGVRIVDARTGPENDGSERWGSVRRGGHIPSATWLSWEELFDPVTMTLRSADEIKKLADDRKLVPGQRIITYCKIGMRSSFALFALHLIGFDKLTLYHGSWDEWGNREDLPLEGGVDGGGVDLP